MTESERDFYDSVVDGLRRAGWSRIEAEDEALERVLKVRRRMDAIRHFPADPTPAADPSRGQTEAKPGK